MYVTYFDEVKANPQNGQHCYFVGGISVPMDQIGAVEREMNALSIDIFGSTDLTTNTEFHASHIYRGKGPFKGMDARKRIEILDRLAQIIAGNEGIKRVYAAIETRKLYNPDKAPEYAFLHFCERVQMLMGKTKTSILIGDLDDEQAKNMIRDFSTYRARGTPWDFGIQIESIVDSVHFARSHHSRMIQLADAYLFLITHRWGSRTGWMADALTALIAGKELYTHRVKVWPS
jgi:hypothetical protein